MVSHRCISGTGHGSPADVWTAYSSIIENYTEPSVRLPAR